MLDKWQALGQTGDAQNGVHQLAGNDSGVLTTHVLYRIESFQFATGITHLLCMGSD